MKGKLLPFLGISFFVFAFILVFSSTAIVDAQEDHKVNICHATSSVTNPFNSISVDKNSTAGGHDSDHNDIIPPFEYIEGDITKNYPGLNWDSEGQAIWNNRCVVPDCLHTSEIPLAWSDWTLDATNNREFRTRLVNIVDAQNSLITCSEPRTEYEYRHIPPCAYQTTVYGTWSDWALVIGNNTLEYRVRTMNKVDSYNTDAVCKYDFEYEYQSTPVCKYTNTQYSDWSDWEINSADNTKYIRTRTVTVNDNIYENQCSFKVESETKPVDACTLTFNGDIVWGDWTVDPKDPTKEYRYGSYTIYDSNNPSITCGTENVDPEVRNVNIPIDTDGEVLGTTDVVTAETAGGLDSYVYLIQSALILMTGLTFATLSKEYLKK